MIQTQWHGYTANKVERNVFFSFRSIPFQRGTVITMKEKERKIV